MSAESTSVKGILNTVNPECWTTYDRAANVKYDTVFVISKILQNSVESGKEATTLNAESITLFEWTNEANCLYLTGRLILNDVENIMMRYFNTYSALAVSIKKYDIEQGTLLKEFNHVFIIDKMNILKQAMRQSDTNDVLIYELTLKSMHLLYLQSHVPFSNWDSKLLDSGNYSTVTKVNSQDKQIAKELIGKMQSSDAVAALKDSCGKENPAAKFIGQATADIGEMQQNDNNPIKIYSIIKTVLNMALNKNKLEFNYENFDEVFEDEQPELKYCATAKDTVLDIINYLQQKLFSVKLPKHITGNSKLGLSYISYDEFEPGFKVVNFKKIESFRANAESREVTDIVQLNGSIDLIRHMNKLKVKLLPQKNQKFFGTTEYFQRFYNDIEYLLLENKNKIAKKVDSVENITKTIRNSNNKLEFLEFDKNFNDLNSKIITEQNIVSLGKNVYETPDTEKGKPFTNLYSEDFDNQSYLKTLETTLNKNTVVVQSMSKFSAVPGMIFKLEFDEGAAGKELYYTQLKGAVMHITKVVHKFFKPAGMQDGEKYTGEELTLCKI